MKKKKTSSVGKNTALVLPKMRKCGYYEAHERKKSAYGVRRDHRTGKVDKAGT